MADDTVRLAELDGFAAWMTGYGFRREPVSAAHGYEVLRLRFCGPGTRSGLLTFYQRPGDDAVTASARGSHYLKRFAAARAVAPTARTTAMTDTAAPLTGDPMRFSIRAAYAMNAAKRFLDACYPGWTDADIAAAPGGRACLEARAGLDALIAAVEGEDDDTPVSAKDIIRPLMAVAAVVHASLPHGSGAPGPDEPALAADPAYGQPLLAARDSLKRLFGRPDLTLGSLDLVRRTIWIDPDPATRPPL